MWFTLNFKAVSAQETQNPNRALRFLSDKRKSFHFDQNVPLLTGFPDGNVYHVQRSHREKCLSLRLGHNEHDAKQVSAQQLDSQTHRYMQFSVLRSVVA